MADKVTIVLHSGDMDKVYSALIIGNGALAMGMDASLYVTFWGLERLKKGALDTGPLSRLNMFGLGKWMMKRRMRKTNVVPLERLFRDFKELGGKVIACDMTMEIMHVGRENLREELISGYGAVGTFIQEARESSVTLFI